MSPKSNAPINVTLNKSSGTWERPEAPKRQLQPWQRLWLVTGIIYLLLLSGSYYMLMPNQERIERRMVFSVTEEVKRYDGMAFAGESPRRIFEIASSQGYATWIASVRSKYQIGPDGNEGFDRVDKEYRDAISGLPIKRNLGVMICFVAWLIPMSAFYAIGSGVDWIKRSVRPIQG
jgi:hypothetical protein